MMRNSPRLALVPHAGKDFAGRARNSVFKALSRNQQEPVEWIYYLAAIHRPLPPSRDEENGVRIFVEIQINKKKEEEEEEKIPLPPYVQDLSQELPWEIVQEHSYRWVKPELQQAFPKAKHVVLYISETRRD